MTSQRLPSVRPRPTFNADTGKSTGDSASDANRYVSMEDWCRLSGIGKTVSYQLLRDGQLRAKKLGRRTLIDLAAGLHWLATQPDWKPRGPDVEAS